MKTIYLLFIYFSCGLYAGNIFFDIDDVGYRVLESKTTQATVSSGGTEYGSRLSLTYSGDAFSRRHSIIPIKSYLSGKGEISFSLKTTNIRAINRTNPNIYLLLKARSKSTIPAEKKVVIYKAKSGTESLFGRERFSTDANYFIDSIHIDVMLKEEGDASIIFDKLKIEYEDNLIDETNLKAALDTLEFSDVTLKRSDRLRLMSGKKSILPFNEIVDGSKSSYFSFQRLVIDKRFWLKKGYFNYQGLIDYLKQFDKASHLIIEFDLRTHPKWLLKNHYVVSDQNDVFIEYCKSFLTHSLYALSKSKLSKKVLGFNLLCGQDRGKKAMAKRLQDPEFHNAYRAWLKTKYSSDESLNSAWGTKGLKLSKFRMPEMDEWAIEKTALTQSSKDHFRFYNLSWVTFLHDICKSLKASLKGTVKVGVSGGPIQFLNDQWSQCYSQSYTCLEAFLNGPVDFFEISVSNNDSRIGESIIGNELFLIDQIHATGKVLFLNYGNSIPKVKDNHSFQVAANYLRRLCRMSLLRGAYLLIDSKSLSSQLKHLHKSYDTELSLIHKQLNKLDRKKVSEVAYVVDPDIGSHVLERNRRYLKANLDYYQNVLPLLFYAQCGMSTDLKLKSELKTLSSYKVIIFMNMTRLSDNDEKMINELKSNGRTLIWANAGAIDKDRFKRLIGYERVPLGKGEYFMNPDIKLSDYLLSNRIKDYFGGQIAYGQRRQIFPYRFSIKPDKNSIPLAHMQDSKQAGLIQIKHKDYSIIYSASPSINPEVTRGALRASKGNIRLNANDQIYEDTQFLSLHARTRENEVLRTVTFEDEVSLYEPFLDYELKGQKSYSMKIKKGTNLLFYKGSKEDWEKGLGD